MGFQLGLVLSVCSPLGLVLSVCSPLVFASLGLVLGEIVIMISSLLFVPHVRGQVFNGSQQSHLGALFELFVRVMFAWDDMDLECYPILIGGLWCESLSCSAYVFVMVHLCCYVVVVLCFLPCCASFKCLKLVWPHVGSV